MLLPSKEAEPKPSKGEGKNLLARKDFLDEMLAYGVVFLLIGKESGKGGVVQGPVRCFLMCFLRMYRMGHHL